jgi:hypothetical protein
MTNLRRKLGAPSATGVTRTYPGVGYLLEDHPTANCARPSVASAGSTPRGPASGQRDESRMRPVSEDVLTNGSLRWRPRGRARRRARGGHRHLAPRHSLRMTYLGPRAPHAMNGMRSAGMVTKGRIMSRSSCSRM